MEKSVSTVTGCECACRESMSLCKCVCRAAEGKADGFHKVGICGLLFYQKKPKRACKEGSVEHFTVSHRAELRLRLVVVAGADHCSPVDGSALSRGRGCDRGQRAAGDRNFLLLFMI